LQQFDVPDGLYHSPVKYFCEVFCYMYAVGMEQHLHNKWVPVPFIEALDFEHWCKKEARHNQTIFIGGMTNGLQEL